jgi:hypothetical protein
MATVYIAAALDAQGRIMDDPALNVTTEIKAEAENMYDWLVGGGWPATLLAVS